MRDFVINLANNILAEVVFWFGLGLVFWLFLQVMQSRFLKFFGLERNRVLSIYLSNLFQPTPERPRGGVISQHEFYVGKSIEDLFRRVPFRYPELVQGLVDRFWSGQKPSRSILVSPQSVEGLVFTSMIVVGATSRNSVRRHCVETEALYLTIDGEKPELPEDVSAKELVPRVRVIRGPEAGNALKGDYNLAIVEKIRDAEHGTVVFMCAGYRADSSWAATEYLVRHWRDLYKKYKGKAFALCLGFPPAREYMEDYIEPALLSSFPSLPADRE